VTPRCLTSIGLAVACAATGCGTTVAAQDAAEQSNELLFALVVNRIFNQGALSLIDDLVAKDVSSDGVPVGREGFKAMIKDLRADRPDFKLTVHDVAATEELVLGHVTQAEGGALQSRVIMLRIDHGWVTEIWNWPDQPPSSVRLGARTPVRASGQRSAPP
jgi:predicted SnoaL-like aldol condensation-catalyzing enzyme